MRIGRIAFDIGASSHTFAAQLDDKVETGKIDNTPEAIGRVLQSRLKRCERLQVLMEGTGIYYLDLALQAAEAGAEVMVVNPKAAHHFAKAMSQRSKTDLLDAKMLLAYLQRMDFVPWTPPARIALELRQFGRHLLRLVEQQTRSKNQLHALRSTQTAPAELVEDLVEAIELLDRRIARLTAKAMERVHGDAEVLARFEALDSIKGVGEATAIALLAELLVLPREMNSRACVSHAGLDVRLRQSGTSVDAAPKLSKHGNRYLRRALYMPAMSAIAHDPHARAFRDRLIAKGKKPKQAIAAVMRKMLTAAWALVRNPDHYDGARLYAPLEG